MDAKLRLSCAAAILSGAFACTITPDSRVIASPAPLLSDPVTGVELLLVRGGCYLMGADGDDCDATPEERPTHEVCVGDFYIGKYEVTRGAWNAVTGVDTSASSTCTADDCPVDDVSWSDVQGFLRTLNGKSAPRHYRLPTEAEWEFAARSGGKAYRYAGGGALGDLAWYADNSGKVNHPVGTKAPNGLGLYDMSGNVWEMTSDWYGATYYSSSPRENPTGPVVGQDHVVRGGCRTGGAANQRTTRRTFISDRTQGTGRGGNVGFRLVTVP